MAKLKLTNRVVRDLKPAARPLIVHDAAVTGFVVVVQPTGARSWYYYGRVAGRPTRIRIGPFPEINADQARTAARAIIGDAAQGKPVAERKQKGKRTVNDLFSHFMLTHSKPRKRTWKRDERIYDGFLRKVIGTRAITSIRRAEIAELLATIAGQEHGRGPAHNVRYLLSKMYRIAIRNEWAESNPVQDIDATPSEPRQRVLLAGEIGRFLAAVEQLESETARDFLKLCLFTGARRSCVGSMEWAEIDAGTWTIPVAKAKAKKAMKIPLTAHALAIIESRRGNGSRYVLPGRSAAGHYSEPKAAMRQVLKLSGLKDLRPHDLRRSMGAWQQKGGASLQTIGQSLGHADIATTSKHYAPVESAQVRESMESAINAMMAAGK